MKLSNLITTLFVFGFGFAITSSHAATVTITTSGTTAITDGDDIVFDTSSGGSDLTVELENSSSLLSDISVGSISADTSSGLVSVSQASGDLFFSDSLSITAGSDALGFSQNVGFSQSDSSFAISGGEFIFEGIFDVMDADASLSSAQLGFLDGGTLGLVVDSITDFGSITGTGSGDIIDFGTSSFLEIIVPTTLTEGDTIELFSSLDGIIDSPDDIIIDNGLSFISLTQDSGDSDLYTGTLDDVDYEFEFDRTNGSATLSVVPEPSTAALLGLVGSVLLLARRRH